MRQPLSRIRASPASMERSLRARNITDQGNGPTPCYVVDPTGCAGVNGPYSGVNHLTPGTYTYQPIPNYFSPYPQTFEVFARAKL